MKKGRNLIDEPTLISYFCKTCQKIVKGIPKGKQERYSFLCPVCGEKCMYGTARSLIHFLRIKEHSENGKLLLQLQKEKLKI